jgi:uncharacterized YccA/Bax inhibitor family protein
METSNPLLQRDIEFSSMEATATMNLQSTINKTGFLLLLCLASAAFSWLHPQLQAVLMPVGLLGGGLACFAGIFVPKISAIAAPAYAVLEGLCIGAFSCLIEAHYPGIVANAVLLTFCVMGLMLFFYTTRIIQVTNRLRMGVFMATGAIALVYLIDMIMNLFGAQMPFINSHGSVGILISLFIVGIAAFNLLLDFDAIETNVRNGAPKFMEWYCGMALLVTLVWLYLEIIRLYSKLQKR